jgi:hypothetical protein
MVMIAESIPGKPVCRRAGGDKRGSAAQRRARKQYLLDRFGNGEVCRCIYCNCELTFATVEADRILPGGSYRRENVIPACRECNVKRLDKSLWSFAPNVARRLVRRGYVVSTSSIVS